MCQTFSTLPWPFQVATIIFGSFKPSRKCHEYRPSKQMAKRLILVTVYHIRFRMHYTGQVCVHMPFEFAINVLTNKYCMCACVFIQSKKQRAEDMTVPINCSIVNSLNHPLTVCNQSHLLSFFIYFCFIYLHMWFCKLQWVKLSWPM